MKFSLYAVLGALLVLSAAACTQEQGATPLVVEPASAGSPDAPEGHTNALAEQAQPVRSERGERGRSEGDEAERGPRGPSSRPGADEGATGGLWVIDNEGQRVGRLLRRGSDDNLVYRAIYDLVTVFHPESGLFFEVTMSDGVVRRPSTTFYQTASCDNPIGISYGGCAECRSGPGSAILHDETWYQVIPGLTFEVTSAGSTMGSGLQDECSSHHTDSAKIFPVEPVTGATPPSVFSPPLHFAWL